MFLHGMGLTSTLSTLYAMGILYLLCSPLRCQWDNLEDAITTWRIRSMQGRFRYCGRHRSHQECFFAEEEHYNMKVGAVTRASKGRAWRLMWDTKGLGDRCC